jgi:hypothetical protein
MFVRGSDDELGPTGHDGLDRRGLHTRGRSHGDACECAEMAAYLGPPGQPLRAP